MLWLAPFPQNGYRICYNCACRLCGSTLLNGLSSCYAFRFAQAFGNRPVSRSSFMTSLDWFKHLSLDFLGHPFPLNRYRFCSFCACRLYGFYPLHWTVLLPCFSFRTGFRGCPVSRSSFAATLPDHLRHLCLSFLGSSFPLNGTMVVLPGLPLMQLSYMSMTVFAKFL